jgi:hypothetical protein
MSLDRIFSICPYLEGSSDGVICGVTGELARNIPDINPDICIGRHFEVCHLYLLKLHDIDVDFCLTATGSTKDR